MNLTLMKYDWLGLRTLTVVMSLLAVCATLLLPAPFSPHADGVHNTFLPLSILSGVLFGLQVFSDSYGVKTWVLSRGLDRRQVFLSRWAAGLIPIIIVAVVIWLLMLLGVRELVQTKMGNGAWYPMVRLGESFVVRDYLLVSIATYCSVIFFRSVHAFGVTTPGWTKTATVISALAAMIAGACWRAPLSLSDLPVGTYLLFWIPTCMLLTWAARSAYAEREVVG
jgi:ABC-type transport system involved in multi-copper enzyme maturation permease subunit